MADQIDRILPHLNDTGLSNKDNKLYQVIKELINGLIAVNKTANAAASASTASGANSDLTFLTVDDESATLPNSRQELPGTGIDFDDTVPNERTVDLEDTAVTPGTYGDDTNVGQFTVDQQGRITSAVDVPITFPSAITIYEDIGITIDGAGNVITTGVKGFRQVNFNGTIVSWTILSTDAAVTSGAIKIDVWKDTYANYPPDNSDSITNGHEPEITATNNRATDNTLGDWTSVTITAGDVLGFNVDSVTSLTRVVLQLVVQHT